MHPFPHHYHVRAEGQGSGGVVEVSAEGLPTLDTEAPPEFGGPPGLWSPETLLAASVANCFILSFRAVARASRLPWRSLRIEVTGVLDRVEGVTRFTQFSLRPRLDLEAGASESQALAVLDKAKRSCLITNSLSATCELLPQVVPAAEAPVT
jgi:organic hydroperoxide reductase OsmC/OhrA